MEASVIRLGEVVATYTKSLRFERRTCMVADFSQYEENTAGTCTTYVSTDDRANGRQPSKQTERVVGPDGSQVNEQADEASNRVTNW